MARASLKSRGQSLHGSVVKVRFRMLAKLIGRKAARELIKKEGRKA